MFISCTQIQPDHFKALIHKGKTLAIIGKYDEVRSNLYLLLAIKQLQS